jgi:hypothetical protein
MIYVLDYLPSKNRRLWVKQVTITNNNSSDFLSIKEINLARLFQQLDEANHCLCTLDYCMAQWANTEHCGPHDLIPSWMWREINKSVHNLRHFSQTFMWGQQICGLNHTWRLAIFINQHPPPLQHPVYPSDINPLQPSGYYYVTPELTLKTSTFLCFFVRISE